MTQCDKIQLIPLAYVKQTHIENEFWKKIITSESRTKQLTIYKPEEKVIVTTAPLITRVTTTRGDNEGLGLWSVMTIEGKKTYESVNH